MNDNIEKNIAPPPHTGTSLQRNEPLPVLAAFNDFIKEEQRKSRNRIIVMGLFFTFIIIIIITAGLLIGTTYYNQVQADLRQTREDLNTYHVKTEVNKDLTKEKISHIQEIANNIAKTIEQQQAELKANKNIIVATKSDFEKELSDMQVALNDLSAKTKKKQKNPEITKMKKVIKDLSDKNKSLQKDAEFAKSKIPELTAQINELQKMVANLSGSINTQQQKIKSAKSTKTTGKYAKNNTRQAKPDNNAKVKQMPTNSEYTKSKSIKTSIPTNDGNIMLLLPIPE